MSQAQSNPEDTTNHGDDEEGSRIYQQGEQCQPSASIDHVADTTGGQDEKRRMQRVLANRNSARVSYLRRKSAVLELRSMSEELSRKNANLKLENMQLRQQLQELRRQMTLLLMATRPSTIQNTSLPSMNSSLLAGIAGTQSQNLVHNFEQSNLTQGYGMGFSSTTSANVTLSNPSHYLGAQHNPDTSLLAVRQAQSYLARALGLPSPPPQPPPDI
jgi:hypothetical protein